MEKRKTKEKEENRRGEERCVIACLNAIKEINSKKEPIMNIKQEQAITREIKGEEGDER